MMWKEGKRRLDGGGVEGFWGYMREKKSICELRRFV